VQVCSPGTVLRDPARRTPAVSGRTAQKHQQGRAAHTSEAAALTFPWREYVSVLTLSEYCASTHTYTHTHTHTHTQESAAARRGLDCCRGARRGASAHTHRLRTHGLARLSPTAGASGERGAYPRVLDGVEGHVVCGLLAAERAPQRRHRERHPAAHRAAYERILSDSD
jgi:hypothetical protein